MTLKFASPLGATTSLGLSLDAAFAAFDLAIENMFAEENADAQGISGTYYLDGIKHSLYDTNCLKDVAADQESAATDSAFEIGDRSEPSDISFDVPTWDSQPLYETAKDATIETAGLVSGLVSGRFAAEQSGSAASSNEVCGDELLGQAETNRTGNVFDGSTQHSSVTGRAVEPSTDGDASRESFATIGIAESSSSIVSAASPVMVSAGATVEIDGASAATVTFAGATGTVVLDDALAFTGKVSGLTGSDALDLGDVSFGSDTTATYLGNTAGGTLTVTDGIHTANIALQGDYLSSTWTLGSDGNGGTTVVDPVSTNTWQALPIGAGGFLDGFSIAQDGTMVVRTDTYGAYIWNGTEWQQLITSTSMPAAFVANAQLYNQGVLELQIAPSDSSVLYMVYAVSQANTYPPLEGVYVSTNQGATWTLTSFAPIADTTMNANGPYRGWGQNMAIDPTNPDIVYVGTGANGLFVTTDGGNTWSSVGGVPVATSDGNGNYPGITGILFDPANTDIIFAASYGNGVYETTNGGTSWSKISGGPSSVQQAAISSNGTYYAIDGSNNLWIDASGTWTEALSSVAGVAVDPFNPNHVVVTQGDGRLDESFNSGVTWSGWSSAPTDVASDIPYQAVLGIDANGLTFDPATPGVLYINSLRSFWTTTLSGNITPSTVPTWTDQGIGIEQLCANEIIVPPIANSTPLVASWDTAVIAPNGSTYASTFGPVANGAVVAGWSIDYASSDPNFIVVLADGGYAGGPQESGYSTNDGQTWNAFPTLPPGGSFGGDIAASTPDNIIFASANGVQPYYTLNGGNTWTPITLPGVSSWSGFIGAYFNDNQVITADRVLANTFYLLDGGVGVFSTTNGGVTWTEVNSSVTSGHQLVSTPGDAGDLWLVSGTSQNPGNQGPGGGAGGSLLHSTNGGVTWTTIANVDEPYCIGFGAAAPGQSYPAIYMVGWVNSVYGVWQSINEAQSWTQIGTWPNGSLDKINTIAGDPNVFGKVYVGFAGSGYEVFSADGPSVLEIDTSPSSGLGEIGAVVTLKLAMSEVTTISGGTPTLTLNDGGTATYVSGSGTDALTFSYTAAAGQNTAALAATAINLNGATMADSGGNAANLSLSGLTQSGPQIDTAVTTITTVAQSANGVLEPGATTTLTLDMSEVVTVAGGTPTLTLNNGGTATYSGGSGTGALTFIYTVGSGQSISSLAATAVDLNGATITNANGAANLSLSGLTQGGPQVEGTPTLAIDGNGFSSSYSPTSSSANVTLTTANPNDVIILNISENGATVASVSDTAGLTWHERAVAGSSGALLYQYYAVAPNALSADTITVNFAATPSYDALNAFGIAGANTASPFDSNASVRATANSGTVAVTTSDADDLIFAAYRFYSSTPASGAGWTAIQAGAGGIMSEYQIVSATQSALVATASTTGENGGIVDAIVQAAAPTSGPTITSIAEAPASGELNTGNVITITLDLSEVVTVNTTGGTPTLTLNDGSTATYLSGSGTSALTFTYTVRSGDETSDLKVTGLNLPNGASIEDAVGNSLSGAVEGNLGLQINNPTAESQSPLTSTEINEIYQTILQRSPSGSEVAASESLSTTAGNAAAIVATVDTPEAQFNLYPIVQIIELATGSLPTPAQLAGWVPFVESAGLLQGQSQTNSLLDQMAEGFVASTVFGNTYNGGIAVDPDAPITASIVSALIQAATSVAASQAQVDAWVATGFSIDQVFVGFALGDQYTAASQNTVQDYLTAIAINGAELSTVDGTSATGALTLGSLQTPLTGNDLTVQGGSGSLTVVASGNSDTITELNTSTAGGTITASGNNNVITVANGANTITANGSDDTINLGAISTGTSITAAQTIHASGAGDTIIFATSAADGAAVTWSGASTVDGGNGSTGIGANSTVNFGTNTAAGTETVVVTGDLTGATTSGGTSTSGIAMITLGNAVNGQGDQIVFNNATTEVLAGTAAVNVTSAGSSLAKALDLAAADAAASQSGGKIGADTGVIDWFQLGGNTYLVEAINTAASAANHPALAATDEVIKIIGAVNLTGESLVGHTLPL